MKLKITGKLLSIERLSRAVRCANADQIRAPAWPTICAGWLPSHKIMSSCSQWHSPRHFRLLVLLRARKISDTQYACVRLNSMTRSSMLSLRFAKKALASLGQHQSKLSSPIWRGRRRRSRLENFHSWGEAQSDLNSVHTKGIAPLLHQEAVIGFWRWTWRLSICTSWPLT